MILMYHKVYAESPTMWWVNPDAFWRQLEALRGYEVVHLDQYEIGNPKQAVITFDGVYENVFTFAFPILKKFAYPFELFIVGETVGKGNEFDQPAEPPARFANKEQLRKMIQEGGRLQWHSRTHQDLTKMDQPSFVKKELTIPAELREMDPKGFRWFAYPHGKHTASIIAFTKKSFSGALSCEEGNDWDRFQLNRVTVVNDTQFKGSTVSVIIPNYNYGHFLSEAVESVLRQTVVPDEILFIDDCSHDNSLEVAEKYKGKIKIVRNEKNLGIIANFNKAVSLTKGDYIAFLGADNRFRSDYIEKCKLALDKHPDCAIAYTNVLLFGPMAEVWAQRFGARPLSNSGEFFLWEFPPFSEEARRNLRYKNIIHGSSMYRRKAFEQVGGYRDSLGPEDQNLFASILEKGWNAILCKDYLLEYRHHSNQQDCTRRISAMEVAHLRRQLKEKDALIKQLAFTLQKYKESGYGINSSLIQNLSKGAIPGDARSWGKGKPRAIAFYLPQFHPIPENDQWWGRGFTEWTNVSKAKPLFSNHYQPHIPADLGFYDLRLPEVRRAQAELAHQYGIYGFCYYHYWFNGKLLLEKPLQEVLKSGEPDFPFCLCWANENWTRVWNGGNQHILMKQEYSEKDDLEHIQYLCNIFRDKRYIRIYGRPLLLVYRPRQFPNPQKTASIWREEARKRRIENLFLCQVESFPEEYNSDPVEIGFDASVEFQPDWNRLGPKLESEIYNGLAVFDYKQMVKNMLTKSQPSYKRFPCVTPSWDNSPRRKERGIIFVNSSPEAYEIWLRKAIEKIGGNESEERIVFINAWNEWGEGNHLEPDQKNGRFFLEATKSALDWAGKRSSMEINLPIVHEEDLFQKAQDLVKDGRIVEAQKALEELIQKSPDHSMALNDLGFLSYQEGNKEKAKSFYKRAIEKNPENLTALKNLADFIFVEERKLDEALSIYLQALKFCPNDVEILLLLGNISLTLGRLEDARVFFNRILEIEPTNIDARKGIEKAKEKRKSQNPLLAKPSGQPLTTFEKEDSDQNLNAGLSSFSPLPQRELEEPLISIIILVLNELEYTKKCVKSIQRNTRAPHEIIFVDNGSREDTTRWLRKAVEENPKYKVIENNENQGFAKGCNQGIQAAGGKYLLLLNNDVVVTEGWISGLRECLEISPKVGIVGPMTNQISGIQKVPQVPYQSIDQLEEFARNFRDKNRHRRIPCRRIVGFCMLFRKELVEQIGLLDENFGTGNFEDDDFCLRAELAGFRNLIAGDVFIHHFGSRTFIANGINYREAMGGNQKIFSEKWNHAVPKTPEEKMYLALRAREAAQRDLDSDRFMKAVDRLLAVIKLGTEGEEGHFALAETLLEGKQYERAIEILKALPPSSRDDRKIVLLGYCQEGISRLEEADGLASQALSLNSKNALALNLKGILAYRSQKVDEAREYFQKAIVADGGYGEPYCNLGVIQWEANRKEEALNLFEKGFTLSPTTGENAQLYHSAITEKGEFLRAEGTFSESKAVHPFHKRIRFLLIDLLIKQKKYERAIEEIAEAIVLFGIEEGMLQAAVQIRKEIGPQEKCIQGPKTGISLCMIVKNEEKFLPKCLQSVKPIVDEMIVVDTGSSDRTKEIAIVLGAKVFDFAWKDDFSAPRNFSLSKAKGDWIIVLDADEMISPQDYRHLLALTRKGSRKAAYSMITRNYTNNLDIMSWTANDGNYEEEAGSGWFASEKVRIFPRNHKIEFENPVHEFVEPSLERNHIPIKKCSIPVHHYGKLNADKEHKKGEEYFSLGKKKLQEKRFDIHSLKELAVQANILGRHQESIELWNQIIQLCPNMTEAYINLTAIHMKREKYEEALVYSQKALDLDPDSREALLNHAIVEFSLGQIKNVITSLEENQAKFAEYPIVLSLLSVAHIIIGDKEKGLGLIRQIRKMGFDDKEYYRNTAEKLNALGRNQEGQKLIDIIEEIDIAGERRNDAFTISGFRCKAKEEERSLKTAT